MIKNGAKRGKKSITLRDVVIHMHHMEVRLTARIDGLDKKLSNRIDNVEEKIVVLTERIEALDVDLTATIKDTIKIRQHVGMPVPLED